MIPSLGFYGRDAHVNLIEEGRLIAGLNTLAEVPELLRQNLLLVPEKVASGVIVDDAEELAKYKVDQINEGLQRFCRMMLSGKPRRSILPLATPRVRCSYGFLHLRMPPIA